MSRSKSGKNRKKRKGKKPFKFIFQDDKGPVFCPLCLKELGGKAKPLTYFPVLVPRRPRGERVTLEGQAGDFVQWHMDYVQMCIEHGAQTLAVTTAKDLTPREDDIHG